MKPHRHLQITTKQGRICRETAWNPAAVCKLRQSDVKPVAKRHEPRRSPENNDRTEPDLSQNDMSYNSCVRYATNNTTPAYGHGTQRQITAYNGIQKAPGTHSHAPDATKVAASHDHSLTRLQASRSHNRIPPPQCKSNLTAACDPPSGRRTARRRSRPVPGRTRNRTGSRQRSSAPWSRRSPYRAGRWPLRYRLRRIPAAWC